DMRGGGEWVDGDRVETRDARSLEPGAADRGIAQYLRPEPLIESDDPQIRAEAEAAVAGATDARARAERLLRRVNAMLGKKPTLSPPPPRQAPPPQLAPRH